MNVTLHFKVKRYQKSGFKAAVDIQCLATSTGGCDPNIFVIQKLPNNFINQPDCRFSHVADPVDMQDWPVRVHDDYAYFRTDHIKLRVRNDFQAKHAINWLQVGARQLVKAVNYLKAAQTIEFQQSYGTQPCWSDSESQSFSYSESGSTSLSYSQSASQSHSWSGCLYGVSFQILQMDLSSSEPSQSSLLPLDLCSHSMYSGLDLDKL